MHPVLITPEGRLLTEQLAAHKEEPPSQDLMGDLFKMAAEEARKQSTNKETNNV